LVRREAIFAAKMLHRGSVFDELVRPSHPPVLGCQFPLAEEFKHCAAVTAHVHVVFEGDNQVSRAGKEFGHTFVERFDEAGVDQGAVDPASVSWEAWRGHGVHVAQTEQGDLAETLSGEVAGYLSHADLEEARLVFDGTPSPVPRGSECSWRVSGGWQ